MYKILYKLILDYVYDLYAKWVLYVELCVIFRCYIIYGIILNFEKYLVLSFLDKRSLIFYNGFIGFLRGWDGIIYISGYVL